jgi:NAD(P)H-hydrate epimerase
MRTLAIESVPSLTTDQMREVDRMMIEELHIELTQMMENAGRGLADLVMRRFAPASVVVLAGSGGNGGGGMVAARHLANRGAAVSVVASSADHEMTPAAAHQLDIVRRMDLRVTAEPDPVELVVDALIGYGLRGDPSGRVADLIDWTNAAGTAVLSLDVPSGLDATTGRPANHCVAATATLTLALPKVGLLSAQQVGELYLADISVPSVVYERMGILVPRLFTEDSLVEIRRRPGP